MTLLIDKVIYVFKNHNPVTLLCIVYCIIYLSRLGSGSEYMIVANGQVVFDDEPACDQVMHVGFFGNLFDFLSEIENIPWSLNYRLFYPVSMKRKL